MALTDDTDSLMDELDEILEVHATKKEHAHEKKEEPGEWQEWISSQVKKSALEDASQQEDSRLQEDEELQEDDEEPSEEEAQSIEDLLDVEEDADDDEEEYSDALPFEYRKRLFKGAAPLLKSKDPQAAIMAKCGGVPYSIDDLLELVYENNASDLHFSAAAPPVIRLHGDLTALDVPRLGADDAKRLLMEILSEQQKEKLFNTMRLDFTYELGAKARFRTNIYFQYYGIAAAFRLIPHDIPTIDELKLPQILKQIAMYRSGICIVTGPTGSGKSTTLAAMINYINEHRDAHIITIEDPVEFFHTNRRCLIDHREVGDHALSFAEAVRSALREDPDIILVGEMRDLETIYQAVKVAETGCLVFATLHTNNASKAVDRMIDVFPAKQQAQIRSMLAQSLRAVIAQQLIKRNDGKGRVVAHEILLAIIGFSNLIREAKTNQIPNFINTGRTYGMQSIDQALLDLVDQGVITYRAAKERSHDAGNFDELARMMGISGGKEEK